MYFTKIANIALLTTLLEQSQEFHFVLRDHFLPGGAHGLGTRLEEFLSEHLL